MSTAAWSELRRFLEAVSSPQTSEPLRLLIAGPHQVGKTTLARALARRLDAEIGAFQTSSRPADALAQTGAAASVPVVWVDGRSIGEAPRASSLAEALLVATAQRFGLATDEPMRVGLDMALARHGTRLRGIEPLSMIKKELSGGDGTADLARRWLGRLERPRMLAHQEAVDLTAQLLRQNDAERIAFVIDHGAIAQTDNHARRRMIAHLAQRLRERLILVVVGDEHAMRPTGWSHRVTLDGSYIAEETESAVPKLIDDVLALYDDANRNGIAIETSPYELLKQSESGIQPLFDALTPLIEPEVGSEIDRLSQAHPSGKRLLQAIGLLGVQSSTRPVEMASLARLLDLSEGQHDDALEWLVERASHGDLSYWPTVGYRIRTEGHRTWDEERAEVSVSYDEMSDYIKAAIVQNLLQMEEVVVDGVATHFVAKYADGRRAHDDALYDLGTGAPLTVDFRHLPSYRRSEPEWVRRSTQEESSLFNRLIWVAGEAPERVWELATDLGRSRRMLARFTPPVARPAPALAFQLAAEQAQAEALETRLATAVDDTFLEGDFYVRGHRQPARELGTTFTAALQAAAERLCPVLLSAERHARPPRESVTDAPGPVVVTWPRRAVVRTPEQLRALLEKVAAEAEAILAEGGTVQFR